MSDDTIRPPHQNWIAMAAILITIIGFGATTWRDVANARDGQAKLDTKVEEMSATISGIRVDIAHVEGKLDVLLERNQAVSKVAIGPDHHLGKGQGYHLAD